MGLVFIRQIYIREVYQGILPPSLDLSRIGTILNYKPFARILDLLLYNGLSATGAARVAFADVAACKTSDWTRSSI